MFDTLVVTKTQKRGASALLGFPAALTLHVVLGMGFILFSLYSPVALTAPPYRAVLYEKPAIPVTLVKPKEVQATQNRNRQETRNDNHGLVAPREVPPTIPTSPPDEGPPGPPESYDPNGLPPELVDNSMPIASPRILGAGDLLESPHLLVQVQPEYPRALEVMRVSGKVVLQIVVNESGAVTEIEVVSSPNPLFSAAAAEAVKKWKYSRPIPPGGGQAKVVMMVVVKFECR
jgi:TonB family protein